jgi:hypothetical protein
VRQPDRIELGLVALLASVVVAVPAVAADDGSAPRQLDDAVLRWGINNESSNRAFAPDTYNFFSAGRVPDPGKGGTTLPRQRWRQQDGDVAIQKWDGSRWRPATWAGLSTDTTGRPLGSPTSGTFSGHRFVFTGGTGEVDPEAGTAHIAWDGDVTVLYYSGMSLFYLTDPVLDVADGRGTLTATVQGYASSVDDPDSWEPVPPASVTVADLPDVDLTDVAGFSAEPAYLGVTVTGVDQVATAEHAGAFPQTYVAYMHRLGTAAFWVSSGGSTDAFKVPLPLTVGYDGSAAPPEPTPTVRPPATQAPIDNPVVPPPATVMVTAAPDPPAAVAPPSVPLPSTAPAAGTLPVAAQLVAATPPLSDPQSSAAPAEPESGVTAVWWLGSGLLLAAALTLLIPIRKEP